MARTRSSTLEAVRKVPGRTTRSREITGTPRLDELDRKLITLMQKAARRSGEAMAKQLAVSPATVRRRARDLVRKGIVRIAAIADPQKVGLTLAAVIALKVEHQQLNSVLKAVAASKEIESGCTLTGQFDIMAMARFRSTDELRRFVEHDLRDIPGIKRAETFICLDVRRGAGDSFSPVLVGRSSG